jgi:hypothetical protein
VYSRRPYPVHWLIRRSHHGHASHHGHRGFSAGPHHRHRHDPLYPGRTIDSDPDKVKQ